MDLTKYELARIIGARALQLACGAPPLIKVSGDTMTFVQVAQEELDKKLTPLAVLRSEQPSSS